MTLARILARTAGTLVSHFLILLVFQLARFGCLLYFLQRVITAYLSLAYGGARLCLSGCCCFQLNIFLLGLFCVVVVNESRTREEVTVVSSLSLARMRSICK